MTDRIKEMTNILTDDQITELFDETFGVDGNLNPDRGAVTVVFTTNTFEDFIVASKSYVERHNPVEGEASVVVNNVKYTFKTLYIARCQVRKGEQRRDVCVIDFGECRGVVVQ